MTEERKALDVWLKFTEPVEGGMAAESDGEMATYEANTYQVGPSAGFVVEWYHNDVGLVSRKWFATYEEARAWLESEGFEDFSAGD